MGHGPSSFKESDVKRALRAIKDAGETAVAVEIEDGRIKIKLKNGNEADESNDDDTSTNPWDKVDLK